MLNCYLKYFDKYIYVKIIYIGTIKKLAKKGETILSEDKMIKEIIDDYEFIKFEGDNKEVEFIFSTSKSDLNFNKDSKGGKDNLNLLCEYFNLKDVGYMNQIHSSNVVEYDGDIKDADAIVTDKTNIGTGIFTADCVPILIYDKKRKVSAAIHSGWGGTSKKIVNKTISTMTLKYGSDPLDLIAYIGPHNRACCYEFGEEYADKYFGEYINKDASIYIDNKLNLEKCIILQLIEIGVPKENIKLLGLCTYCNTDYKFYSYRKDKNEGRMFSFVIIR